MSGGDIRCSAVIVAAGSAQRMQGIDKLLAPLDGVPVLRRTVEALASAPEITELIVVTRADRLEAVQALCEGKRGRSPSCAAFLRQPCPMPPFMTVRVRSSRMR